MQNDKIINKNVIQLKNFFKLLDLSYCPHLLFDTGDYRIKNRLNKIYPSKNDLEKSEPYANKLNYKGHREIKKPELSIQRISKEFGYGLFAEQDFEIHDYIGEFCGTVTINYDSTSNNYNYNYFNDDSGIVIAPRKVGNELQFANHSYKPNSCWTTIFGSDGKYHVIFVAKTNIKKNDQILVDYGEEYWKAHGTIPINI
jgi:SET domain-containing protein